MDTTQQDTPPSLDTLPTKRLPGRPRKDPNDPQSLSPPKRRRRKKRKSRAQQSRNRLQSSNLQSSNLQNESGSATPMPTGSTPTPTAPNSTTSKRTRTFIYRPQDEGDRLEHEVPGTDIRLRANVPVEIADSVTILQLLREERETPEGIRTRAIERRVPLYQAYAGNPWFEIDGVRPPRKLASAKLPETPDEYRGYAIAWLANSFSARDIDIRWANEEGLRQRCGVSPTELGWILPFMQNRKQEAATIDAMRTA